MNGQWIDLGRLEYARCSELQGRALDAVARGELKPTLLFVEHPPVLTLGANFHEGNLLLGPDEYRRLGIAIERTERGGDVTYHGPGQLVAYPIFPLSLVGRDLHRWMRSLEQAVIEALLTIGLKGARFTPHTGVWVHGRKICAIGVKVRKWVSMHGLALNCDNDLRPFDLIVPCGIQGRAVTSVSRELGRPMAVHEVQPRMVIAFESVFDILLAPGSQEDLLDRLSLRAAAT